METLKVALGGKDYEIKELTLGQLEEIQEVLLNSEPKDHNRKILAIALSEDDVTEDDIRKMRLGSIRKVNEVVMLILRFAGYEMKDKKSGESPGVA